MVFVEVQVKLLEKWRWERRSMVAAISGVFSSLSSSSLWVWVGARLYTWMLTSYNFSNSSSLDNLTPWNFFFPYPALDTADNSTGYLSPNFWCDSHYVKPDSGKSRDDLHTACLFGYRDPMGWFRGSLQCSRVDIFLDQWNDPWFSKQTRWRSWWDPPPIYYSGAAVEPTLRNRCYWFGHTSGLNQLDEKRGKVFLTPGCCCRMDDDTGGPQSLYYGE